MRALTLGEMDFVTGGKKGGGGGNNSGGANNNRTNTGNRRVVSAPGKGDLQKPPPKSKDCGVLAGLTAGLTGYSIAMAADNPVVAGIAGGLAAVSGVFASNSCSTFPN